jgi:hypothetical protein
MAESNKSNLPPLELDPRIVRAGLRRAMTRSGDTLLCVVNPSSLRCIGISGLRMMISWEHPIQGPKTSRFFVFPRLAVQVLTSMVGQELTALALANIGTQTVAQMQDQRGRYELRWPADLRQFMVPPEFTQMLTPPPSMIPTTYLALSDAAHQAVADLLNLQATQGVPADKLAILVDFAASHLTLDGRTIVHGARGTFYFDPRLIIRALELFRSNELQVGIQPLPVGHRAVLTVLAEQEGWRAHCAILSIGMETQKLYPLPSERLAAAAR